MDCWTDWLAFLFWVEHLFRRKTFLENKLGDLSEKTPGKTRNWREEEYHSQHILFRTASCLLTRKTEDFITHCSVQPWTLSRKASYNVFLMICSKCSWTLFINSNFSQETKLSSSSRMFCVSLWGFYRNNNYKKYYFYRHDESFHCVSNLSLISHQAPVNDNLKLWSLSWCPTVLAIPFSPPPEPEPARGLIVTGISTGPAPGGTRPVCWLRDNSQPGRTQSGQVSPHFQSSPGREWRVIIRFIIINLIQCYRVI